MCDNLVAVYCMVFGSDSLHQHVECYREINWVENKKDRKDIEWSMMELTYYYEIRVSK